MAMIPLKETAEIKRVQLDSNGDPLIDAWGNPTYSSPVSYPCRISERTKLVRDQNGYEVVSNTQILLDKAVAVSYEDEITFTDLSGQSVTKKPISISATKDISSKVLFTKVSI